MKRLSTILFSVAIISHVINAQNLFRAADTISTNNIKMWVINNGWESHNPEVDSAGFYWPNDGVQRHHLIYLSGLQLGGRVNKELYISGINYDRSSYQAGIIGGEKNDSLGRIWRIKKDWEALPESEEKDYLKFNYDNWPGELGAPFDDVNNDGVFTRSTDKPKFIGDEVLFYTFYSNSTTDKIYDDDTNHPALQIQVTLWSSDSSQILSNTIFERINIINKDTITFKDFYSAYWIDSDLGYPMDDYVGCYPPYYLAYSWNTFDNDPFFGSPSPAIGHVVLSGFKKDGRNLMMTAFGPNFKISSSSYDPRNAVEHYNVIRGLLTNGEPIIDPYTNKATEFPLNGNPETEEGWYEGGDWPAGVTFGNHPPYPGDRRYYVITGPVDFAPGDTQSITIAHIVAKGNSNRNSVTKLKETAFAIHQYFGNDFITGVKSNKSLSPPNNIKLYQNYPNPFSGGSGNNPTTTIRYSIAFDNTQQTESISSMSESSQHVTLKIYDPLGREVKTLVNEIQPPGDYSAIFNASDLPSGVYIYVLKSGKMSIARKLIYLK